ncbi:MAG: OmpH family outer membrane protein [Phascolarctobacterium sp.]|nr:OmpH family outer membrane protein [Phascolarctobacterium sp.]MCD8175828.1 OmpH family outer membrane protein [Phascolarctobacterium sp.]
MMQQLRNPKNVKMVSLIVAAIFVIGCFAYSIDKGIFSASSEAAMESAIGTINYQALITQSPGVENVREIMQAEIEVAQNEFNEKSQDMNEDQKRSHYSELQERLAAKEKELLEPIRAKTKEEIKKVADKKGLSVVVDKKTVIFGGVDITEDVLKALRTEK